MKRILCIQDLSTVGRSSLAVVSPVLSVMGYQCCPLPTALLSTHTGGFGTPARLDGCAYGEAALEHYRELEELQRSIHDRLKSVLGLETRVTLVEPKSLERFQGKAKRILDLRNEPDGGMGTSCIGTARP